MITRPTASFFLVGVACLGVAHSASLGVTVEEDQRAIDQCKSPTQVVTYAVAAAKPKAVDAPATVEEDDRVRNMMAAAGMTYDRVNRRATFEFVLGLVRTNGVIRFHIASIDPAGTTASSDDSAGLDITKRCLTGLAHEIGMAAEFDIGAQDTKQSATDGTSEGHS